MSRQNESDQKSTQLKELSSAGTQPKNSSSAGTQQNESSSAAVSGGWGWGSWSTVLNQATNTMTSGLSQVIEKVETTLGIPEPGELEDEAFSKDQKKEVITMEPTPAEIDRNVDESNNIAGKPCQVDHVEIQQVQFYIFIPYVNIFHCNFIILQKCFQ